MKKQYYYYIIGGAILLGGVAYLVSRDTEESYPDTNTKYLPDTKGINLNSPYGRNLIDFANNRVLVSKLAQELHDAMKFIGTKFNKIEKALDGIDEKQFEIIYQRFGKRPYYNDFWGLKTGSGELLDLKAWFKEELSNSQYQQLKDKYPKML